MSLFVNHGKTMFNHGLGCMLMFVPMKKMPESALFIPPLIPTSLWQLTVTTVTGRRAGWTSFPLHPGAGY
jgi:hypothetical protein